MTPLRTLEADRGTTRKTLWRLFDGALVESVLMRYPDRVTMCVSSARPAAGWPARSAPPARAACSATCPPPRSSSRSSPAPGRWPAARCPGGPGRVSNVVFMGMGEPMANYKAVIGAVRRLTDPRPTASACRARGVTVSTVGLVPRINQLAEEGIPVTLALTPARARRRAAQRAGPDQHPLLGRRDRRRRPGTTRGSTKRRVSIEYAMMRGINDQAWRADLLGRRAARSYGDWGWVHVNLIPLNPTPGSKWTASDPADEREFVRRLEAQAASRPPSATPAAARSTAPAASSRRSTARSPSRAEPRRPDEQLDVAVLRSPPRPVVRSCQSLADSSRDRPARATGSDRLPP